MTFVTEPERRVLLGDGVSQRFRAINSLARLGQVNKKAYYDFSPYVVSSNASGPAPKLPQRQSRAAGR